MFGQIFDIMYPKMTDKRNLPLYNKVIDKIDKKYENWEE
jgi:hypothetical protein